MKRSKSLIPSPGAAERATILATKTAGCGSVGTQRRHTVFPNITGPSEINQAHFIRMRQRTPTVVECSQNKTPALNPMFMFLTSAAEENGPN